MPRKRKITEEERKKYNAYHREYKKSHPLSNEQREKRNAYLREYMKRYPQKAKQYQLNYTTKKAARLTNQTTGKEI